MLTLNVFPYHEIYDLKAFPKAVRTKSFLREITLGRVEAYISSIAWDEIVCVVRKVLGVDISMPQGRMFLSFPSLGILPVRRTTVLKAQELVEEHELKLRHALHAAAALKTS